MHYRFRYAVAIALLSATPSLFASPTPKQLAGPPSEFSQMKLPLAADHALHSKSALIPISLTQDQYGLWRWQGRLPVEADDLQIALFTGAASDWQMGMRTPYGTLHQNAERLAREQQEMLYGINNNEYPADYFHFQNLGPGDWVLDISAPSATQTEGFVLVHNTGPHRLLSYQIERNQWAGQRIGFVAHGYTIDNKASSLTVAADMVTESYLRVTAPDGVSWQEPMYDDGLHRDGKAGDGIFGGDFLADHAGDYTVQVVASGHTPQGTPLLRTAEYAVPVVEQQTSLASDFATTSALNDKRLMVNIALNSLHDTGHYRVVAEVWGSAAKGSRTQVPIAWIGGMSELKNGSLELGLDARWIALAGAHAPFELRNLRIEDAEHYIPLIQAAQLNLAINAMPAAAARAVNHIDEEMVMGPRPPDLSGELRAGSRLLLVHGYCSGDVWGPVAGQFSGASVFADFNQNRSHDAFARRILSFGNSFSSYGIVAHSQGGAAAMHLYAFYWSGLDFAGSGRLIQSVGTPYQGTSLAGNLAVLGQVFGAGCGSNTDLTYNGAASWLSGIPSFARAATNYYTTSFTDRSFRFDYCHLATDLLLSDPDDGTTERSRGQLPGGINRGHRTGWCHTTGMRDPAQYRDSGRNSTMNANAAR